MKFHELYFISLNQLINDKTHKVNILVFKSVVVQFANEHILFRSTVNFDFGLQIYLFQLKLRVNFCLKKNK